MLKNNEVSSDRKIKSSKDIKTIFAAGKTVYSTNKKIKAIYCTKKISDDGRIKYAVAVSKKAGNAVWRNRLKRLIKEAHQLSSGDLLSFCFRNKLLLEIIFTTSARNESFPGKNHFRNIMSEIDAVHSEIKINLAHETH